jgi:hypothetical protein
MFYKPKYCAECAAELQDYGESFWLKSRFCEVCQPNFNKIELVSKFGGAGIAAVATIFGIGTLLQKSVEIPLNVAKTEIVSIAPAPKPTQKVENKPPNVIVQPKQVEANRQGALKSKELETQAKNPTADKKTQSTVREASSDTVPEVVYFCGAKTKKGTPCARKVKGNERCWQHLGQDAILPAKDLRIQ